VKSTTANWGKDDVERVTSFGRSAREAATLTNRHLVTEYEVTAERTMDTALDDLFAVVVASTLSALDAQGRLLPDGGVISETHYGAVYADGDVYVFTSHDDARAHIAAAAMPGDVATLSVRDVRDFPDGSRLTGAWRPMDDDGEIEPAVAVVGETETDEVAEVNSEVVETADNHLVLAGEDHGGRGAGA